MVQLSGICLQLNLLENPAKVSSYMLHIPCESYDIDP